MMKGGKYGCLTLCVLAVCVILSFAMDDANAEDTTTYSLSINVDSDGYESGCTVSGSGDYEAGAMVTISATPVEGYHFLFWILDDYSTFSESATYTFPMPANDLHLTANFGPHIMMAYDLKDGNHTVKCMSCDLMEIESEPHEDADGDLDCDECYYHIHPLGEPLYDEWIHWYHCDVCDAMIYPECHYSYEDDNTCNVCPAEFTRSDIWVVDREMSFDDEFPVDYAIYFTPDGSITIESGGTLFVPTNDPMELQLIGQGRIITMLPGSILNIGNMVTVLTETWVLELNGSGTVTSDGESDIVIDLENDSSFEFGAVTVFGGMDEEVTVYYSNNTVPETQAQTLGRTSDVPEVWKSWRIDVELDIPDMTLEGYGGPSGPLSIGDLTGTMSIVASDKGLTIESIQSLDVSMDVVDPETGDMDVHFDVKYDEDGLHVDRTPIDATTTEPVDEGDDWTLVAIALVVVVIIAVVGLFLLKNRRKNA